MIKRYIFFLVMILLLTSCTPQGDKAVSNQLGLDMKGTKPEGDETLITELYVTVLSQSDPDNLGFTFRELNDGEDIRLPIVFREGNTGEVDENFSGNEMTLSNGTIELRGQSSRLADEKSFKISLNEDRWQGFKIINLNKHPFDSLKIRNKLSFDLLNDIPDLTTPSTKFIHLFIKDLSQKSDNAHFQDFGLFTHVENIDGDFLNKKGLNPNGSLYKAENFEFQRYPEALKSKKEPDYSKEKFEEILEIKGEGDHQKLLAMLNDVNNNFVHINKVIDKYFDRQNYLTWLAVSILTDNIDTSSRNFFLYNSQSNDKWLFIPWDYDGSFGKKKEDERALWQDGITKYWAVTLHRRFVKNNENRFELTQKIEEMTQYFSEKNIEDLLNSYEPLIRDFVISRKVYESDNNELIWNEFKQLPQTIELNKESYYKSLERPMPVFMGSPIKYGDYFIFTWEYSYDFQGDLIEYGIDISRTPDFKDTIFSTGGLRENQCIVKDLTPGKYYWKLTIRDSKGNQQEAFDKYADRATGLNYFGIKEFMIE